MGQRFELNGLKSQTDDDGLSHGSYEKKFLASLAYCFSCAAFVQIEIFQQSLLWILLNFGTIFRIPKRIKPKSFGDPLHIFSPLGKLHLDGDLK